MAGVNDNLRPKPFTSETAREAGRKGGIASGIAKRRKANLRKAMQMLLSFILLHFWPLVKVCLFDCFEHLA